MSIKTSDLETAGFWYNLRVTATGNNGGSSNGRTPGFGPGYWGSNPCPPASKRQTTRHEVLTQPNQAIFRVRTLHI